MLKSFILLALAAHGVSASVARAPKGTPRRSNSAEVKAAQLMFEQVKLQAGTEITPEVGEMITTMIGYIEDILKDMKIDKDATQAELDKIGQDVTTADETAKQHFQMAKDADARLVACREEEKRVKIQEEVICEDAEECWNGPEGCNQLLQQCKDAQLWEYELSANHNCNDSPDILKAAGCPKKCELKDIRWANHQNGQGDINEINPANECPDFKSFDDDVNQLVSNFEDKYDEWKALHERCKECEDECNEKDDNCTDAEEKWELQRNECEAEWVVFRRLACQYGSSLHEMCSLNDELSDFHFLVFSPEDRHSGMAVGQTASQAYPDITVRDVGLSEIDRNQEYSVLMEMKCILQSYKANDGKLDENAMALCDKNEQSYQEKIGTLTRPELTLHNDCKKVDNRITFSGFAWTIGSSSEHYRKLPIEFIACIDNTKCESHEVFDFCLPKHFTIQPAAWTDTKITTRSDTRVICQDQWPVVRLGSALMKFTVTNSDEPRTSSMETTFQETQDSIIEVDMSAVLAEDSTMWPSNTPPSYSFFCDVDTKFYQKNSNGADTSR